MAGVINNSSVNLTGLVALGGSVTVAAAITHAADTNKADVVNMSMNWGSNRIFSTDPALPRPKRLADVDPIAPDVAADAIANVRNTKTLFVVAAGNESVNIFDDAPETDKVVARNDELRRQGRLNEVSTPDFAPYPCRPKNGGRKSVLQMPDGTYDRGNIICVASANWYGAPSDFTNWGAGVVDVAAPGENMVGPDASDGLSFKSGDGTSYSAPVVAGIAAMINQKFPGINEASIVKCAILSSATTRPLVISGLDFGTTWKSPFKAYADRMMLGEEPGKLPVGKRVLTVTGMAQADEALSAAGSLWSRYRAAVRKNTAKPKCVQRRAGSFWGKGKWTNAADLPPGF
jgi:subtilisin family serine protease